MAIDAENNLWNVLADHDFAVDSSFDRNPSCEVNKDHDKSAIKRPKPTLRCVVCGDHAFGKMNIFFYMIYLYLH
jgi:hypothetical protein